MNPIKTILAGFCRTRGIWGAIVLTKEGILIDSLIMLEGENPEHLAAFMSQIAQAIRNSLATVSPNSMFKYSCASNKHTIYMEDLGKALLVGFADLEVDYKKINMAIFQAANEIKKTGRIA